MISQKYCTNCGKQADAGDLYCKQCGKSMTYGDLENSHTREKKDDEEIIRTKENNSVFFTLTCPTCNGKLQITEDIDRFACGYCGNEHIVNRNGGVVSLKPVIESIKKVQVGVDKTASELAIVRLKSEINEIEGDIYFKEREYGQGKNNEVFGFIAGLLFLFFISLIVGVVISNQESNLSSAAFLFWIIAILFLAGSVTVYAISYRKEKEFDRNIDKELDSLFYMLEGKKKELAEHQSTVSR